MIDYNQSSVATLANSVDTDQNKASDLGPHYVTFFQQFKEMDIQILGKIW